MCTIAMIIWTIFHPPGERTFFVPSTAMAPAMIIGDIVVSVPYGRGATPERGHVIAFTDPGDPRTIQMFRIIGLPGDTVRLEGGTVVLNGVPLARDRIGDYVIDFGYELMPSEAWRETLPDGRAYDTLDTEPEGFLDDTPEFVVPGGHYFVLGDNRDNSADSRLADRIGYVPAANVIGRIERILASCKPDGRFLADRTGLALGP